MIIKSFFFTSSNIYSKYNHQLKYTLNKLKEYPHLALIIIKTNNLLFEFKLKSSKNVKFKVELLKIEDQIFLLVDTIINSTKTILYLEKNPDNDTHKYIEKNDILLKIEKALNTFKTIITDFDSIFSKKDFLIQPISKITNDLQKEFTSIKNHKIEIDKYLDD